MMMISLRFQKLFIVSKRLGLQQDISLHNLVNSDEDDEIDEVSVDSLEKNRTNRNYPEAEDFPDIKIAKNLDELKNEIYTYITQHEKNSPEYLYNFSAVHYVLQQKLFTISRGNQKKRERSIELYKGPDYLFRSIFLLWKEFYNQRKNLREKLRQVSTSLHSSGRVRRFFPLKQQRRCIDRCGKEQFANLFLRWKRARLIFDLLILNYCQRNQREEEED